MNSIFFNSSDWQSITFRLSVALLVGGAIGINRQQPGRPAGLRTFMIVSLGAAIFVMIPLQIDNENTSSSANAISRTLQGVATGVGFLGAGIILQQNQNKFGRTQVKGLTSAATIWLAAGLGAAAGCGLWRMSLIGTVFALGVLSGVKKLEKATLLRRPYTQNRIKTRVKEAPSSQDIQEK
ncbi:MgtC/SapB family protein [Kamptonema animale CS-326]|jgi:putative Mg2+ transporter-C (MgtC) family protein|uniref:MgtC/SapB family protein n=1 Tax=Kamptonema animale TaxID=92934 RepID=UPI00232EF4D2|nr:MgtC/SapB family protein [Kamptonema animale]MDB9515117.1 MgtC/SapB family protein [Kamptonema animale CS-326]